RRHTRFSRDWSSECALPISLYVFYSLHLEQIGYSKSLIGLMWAVGVICEIAFFFYQAPIFRRFGVRNLMLASLALAVVRFLMIRSEERRVGKECRYRSTPHQ